MPECTPSIHNSQNETYNGSPEPRYYSRRVTRAWRLKKKNLSESVVEILANRNLHENDGDNRRREEQRRHDNMKILRRAHTMPNSVIKPTSRKDNPRHERKAIVPAGNGQLLPCAFLQAEVS
jgi:hypothetical protein